MTGSEALITVLTGALTVAVTVAGFLAAGWMSKVEKAIEETGHQISRFGKHLEKLEHQVSETEHRLIEHNISMKERVKQHVEFGLRTSTEKKIDVINREVAEVKELATQQIIPRLQKQEEELGRVIPALNEQKQSFGRILDLDKQVSETERKVLTLYEVMKKVVEQLPRQGK